MCCLLYKATKKQLENNYSSPVFLVTAFLLWVCFGLSIVCTTSLHWMQDTNGGHEGIFIACFEANRHCRFIGKQFTCLSSPFIFTYTHKRIHGYQYSLTFSNSHVNWPASENLWNCTFFPSLFYLSYILLSAILSTFYVYSSV